MLEIYVFADQWLSVHESNVLELACSFGHHVEEDDLGNLRISEDKCSSLLVDSPVKVST